MTSMDAPPDVAEDDQGFSTEYEMGQDNIRPMGLDIHNPVFLISSVLIFAFVLVSLANQEASAEFFGWLRPWLTSTFDWFLVLSVNAITLFCLALIILPVGSVRIGGKDAKPDYSYAGWIAMMFAAGIGIGLLFFGVLEPVYYNFSEGGAARPLGIDATQPGNEYIGIVGTIHHWGTGRLGNLCCRRPQPCDILLQSQSAADVAFGLLSDIGRTGLGLVGTRHRYACRFRNAVWIDHISGVGCTTGCRRSQRSSRH